MQGAALRSTKARSTNSTSFSRTTTTTTKPLRRSYSSAAATLSTPEPRHSHHHHPALTPSIVDASTLNNTIISQAPLQLSTEQQFLMQQVLHNKKSVFFTGSAGTGKSVLLRQLIENLREHYKPGQVAVTASTGIAACNIGGCTLHAFAGIGLGNGTVDQLMVKLEENKRAKQRWKKTKVLIIDESKSYYLLSFVLHPLLWGGGFL
jgi:ATP-dependent exoDNAse (exonuclease V) alpha subunit